jgi:hypothetical protein
MTALSPIDMKCKDCGLDGTRCLYPDCLPLATTSEWKPIESAPRGEKNVRDGLNILLYWPNCEPCIGRWKYNHRIGAAYFSYTDEMDDTYLVHDQPTHWMPLPPAPEGNS